jgi:hypothetical protein
LCRDRDVTLKVDRTEAVELTVGAAIRTGIKPPMSTA